ncbi:MAG: hypothetical protein ACYTHJ_03040 [Planctomycetota bacterium]|jgi:hypothetical protein
MTPEQGKKSGSSGYKMPTGPPPGHGASLVYLFLVGMGLVTLAPSVLLPEWRKYEALDQEVQAQQYKLDLITREIDEQKRILEAIKTDPAVFRRLAQRELNLFPEGTRAIRVNAQPAGDAGDSGFVPKPTVPPAFFARLSVFLPNLNYDIIFCDQRVRPYIMALSIGMVMVAFAVFRQRIQRPAVDH